MKIVSKARQARAQYSGRIGRPVSTSEVAKAIGIDRGALTKIEQGKTSRIDFDILAKLCAYYGVQLGDLFEYSPEDIKRPELVTAFAP